MEVNQPFPAPYNPLHYVISELFFYHCPITKVFGVFPLIVPPFFPSLEDPATGLIALHFLFPFHFLGPSAPWWIGSICRDLAGVFAPEKFSIFGIGSSIATRVSPGFAHLHQCLARHPATLSYLAMVFF